MSYQITEEIISFWNALALPVIFGIITSFLIFYIMGKSNRDKFIEWLIDENDRKYVLKNGLYIPYALSRKARVRKKIGEIIGDSGIRSLLIFFVGLVIMYGAYNIIVYTIFQPQLTHNMNILFSSGADNYMLAVLWSKTSNSENLYSVLQYINENTEVNKKYTVLYAFEAQIRFYILISILAIFLAVRKKRSVEKRDIICNSFKVLSILLILLIGVYALQIRNQNNIIERKCQIAYQELDENMLIPKDEEIKVYIDKIEDMKEQSSKSIFYGAYSLKAIYEIQSFTQKIMKMIYTCN